MSDERLAAFRKHVDVERELAATLGPGIDATSVSSMFGKLERWVGDQSVAYYRDYARALKKVSFLCLLHTQRMFTFVQPKTSLHKQTQLRLMIRLAFKIGFLAEFRGDLAAALKYYTQAYAATSEWRMALAARVRSAIALNAEQLASGAAADDSGSSKEAQEGLCCFCEAAL